MQARKEIQVSGIVQGVGFRPYVFRLATELDLSGTISNTSTGVTIEIQGPTELIDHFVLRLPREAPTLAHITGVAIRELPCKGDRTFQILASHTGEPVRTWISADIAICGDCLRELFDPTDRRYLYPFINCTNCGPRFTIVRDIPYDRCRTSMDEFPMCGACRAEYEDIHNRRFHTQPNACWECGPQLEWWDAQGHRIATSDPVREAAQRLRMGDVVAVKGLGGFHLAADATNPSAIERLRERKRRGEKPFALMVPDLEAALSFCEVNDCARIALVNRQRPIVLMPKKKGAILAQAVAPRQGDLGVLLPYTPLHHLLFAKGRFSALVMTSGNLSEEPIAVDNQEAVARLAAVADFFLVHNRDILLRCDDSVVRPGTRGLEQIRRSRGYVPVPLELHRTLPAVLAVGGELKNTICLARGNLAFLSQHIGDLENVESFTFFREAIDHLSSILEIEPKIISYDLHPSYLSTQWALAQKNAHLVGVQHHHAHIASCMEENGVKGRVIGLALDGAGYGTDGTIWGGEALLADYSGFERAAHLAYVRMPGGSAAIREPWRMALSYLMHHFGAEFLEWEIPFVGRLNRKKAETILEMTNKGVNSPLTSSCGRLFDAVAAVMGLRGEVNYEAQAAMELEMFARRTAEAGAYPFDIRRTNRCWEIETRTLFAAILEDLTRNVAFESISRRFHNGLVAVLTRLACLLRQESGLNRVCLSGGVFHNTLLREQLIGDLEAAEFTVFTHSQVPAGDGGLSLGQAVIAGRRVSEG